MSKANLNYSPLSQRVFWGKINDKGCSIGEQRDVTNAFLQIVEMKFSPSSVHTISANGEAKFRLISVKIDDVVTVNGEVV